MNYEKIVYPLAWFSLTINFLAGAFCTWCLVGVIGKFGFLHPVPFLGVACIAFNVYLFVKGVQKYRDMKKMDESIKILEGVLAEIEAEQKLREEANAKSPTTEEVKELP